MSNVSTVLIFTSLMNYLFFKDNSEFTQQDSYLSTRISYGRKGKQYFYYYYSVNYVNHEIFIASKEL